MKPTLLPVALAALLLAGCTTTREPVEEKTESPADARLEALESVEQKIQAGDTEQALTTYQEAFGTTPVGAADTILYATLLREAGSLEQARAVLEALVHTDAHNAEALYGLALLEQASGSKDRYRALLEEALAVDADHSEASAALGELYRKEGDLGRAEELFRRVWYSRHVVAYLEP